MGIKLADPRPDFCTACYNTTAEVYVDLDCVIDGPVIVDENGVPRTKSDGLPSASDQLYLCLECATTVGEAISFKPQLHLRQVNEIRRLRTEAEHWKALARRLGATVDEEIKVLQGAA